MKPVYYPLEKAATMLDITKAELIHQAMLGRIKIVIPKTDNHVFWIETIEPESNSLRVELKGEAWADWLWFSRRYLEEDANYGASAPSGAALSIHKTSLKDIEAGYDEEDLVLYLRRSKDGCFSERVKLRNPCTEKPLLIKDAKLYVLAKDLERFTQLKLQSDSAGESEPKPEPHTTHEARAPWEIQHPDDIDKKQAKHWQPWFTAARYFARELVSEDRSYLNKDKTNMLAGKVAKKLLEKGIEKSRKRENSEGFATSTVKKAFYGVDLSKKNPT